METKTMTLALQLTGAIKRGLPTRWVLRANIGDEQWAVLVECQPGPAPETGGFIFQMLREDGQPAHKLREITWEDLEFHVAGEGVVKCVTGRIDGLADGLATLADIEAEGFSWDCTIYEPDRSKLSLGVVDWVKWEGANDGD